LREIYAPTSVDDAQPTIKSGSFMQREHALGA